AWDEALSGLAGPVVGTAGAFAALGLADVYDSQLLRVLAYVGFFVNLVNLLPVLPLDGGRTVAALSPRIWLGGLAALLAYEVWRPSPVVPLVLVVGGVELYRRWKGRDGDYYALAREQRLAIGSAYVGLVVLLLWAMHAHPLPPR
ncbi:MAG: site-2 protease family protein, partial [Mycobacteriales bacterium]